MLFLWRTSGLRLYCCFFRLMLVVSISLLIGIFVFNILLVNQRPRFLEKDEKGVIPENLDKTPKFFEDKSEKIPVFAQPKKKKKKRQNLIIVAHGRSGSTFLGNIFNNHPSVFYLFEPYKISVLLWIIFYNQAFTDFCKVFVGRMSHFVKCILSMCLSFLSPGDDKTHLLPWVGRECMISL